MLAGFEKASRRVGRNLGIQEFAGRRFDRALDEWVSAFKSALEVPHHQRRAIPGLDPTAVDRQLTSVLSGLDESSMLYAWIKMWVVQDSLFASLELPITGPRLEKHIQSVAPRRRLTAAEARAVLPLVVLAAGDRGLQDHLWAEFKGARLLGSDSEVRDELLEAFVTLEEGQFGFSYARINRVLSAMRGQDARARAALERFGTPPARASASFVSEVIRHVGVASNHSPGEPARATLSWFQSARRSVADDRWRTRRQDLERDVTHDVLQLLARWVRARPQARYFGDGPYRDELFCLLWKSASWYLGEPI